SLAAVKRDGGILLAEFFVLGWLIVVTENIHRLLKAVVASIDRVTPGGNRASRVFVAGDLRERGGDFMPFSIPLFANLIAGAPQDNARMIAVAAHHRAQIFLVPVY